MVIFFSFSSLEISMLDGRFFDKLEAVARRIRGDERCFGGVQVIACGDFFQLPPVGLGKNSVIYCFESECWKAVIQVLYSNFSSVENDYYENCVSTER